MYHPAKVEHVVDADGPVLMVETWDNNLFTLATADDIDAEDVAEGDVVLVDYYPREGLDLPSPKQEVSHVLDDEDGETVWETYEQSFEAGPEQQTGAMGGMPGQRFDGNYIG